MKSRAVTVAAIAVVLVSVGSATAAPAESAAPAPAPGPVDRWNKSDMARARAAVLRPADVFSNFTRDRSGTREPTIAHCNGYPGDRSDVTITGEARSAFRLRGFSIGSTVLWFKTAADAGRYWAKTVRLQYIRCRAAGILLANGAGEYIAPQIAQAAKVPLRPTGADKAVAYRFIAGVHSTPGPGNDSYNWIDTNAFVKVGRAVAMLRTVWITSHCDCHHDLARVLATRLKRGASSA